MGYREYNCNQHGIICARRALLGCSRREPLFVRGEGVHGSQVSEQEGSVDRLRR